VEFLPGRNMGPVGFAGRWGMQRIGITMSEFASELPGRWLNGVVTDLTGLTGKYTFTLKWSDRLSAPSTDGATAPEFSDPPFQVALRQQLGLVVRETKGPAEVLVVESVQKPTEN
jgi:uncharacterized protein (TIGR03435 family)